MKEIIQMNIDESYLLKREYLTEKEPKDFSNFIENEKIITETGEVKVKEIKIEEAKKEQQEAEKEKETDRNEARKTKKDKKEIQIIIKLDVADVKALEAGMNQVGETNKSSYIRRLIHANRGY